MKYLLLSAFVFALFSCSNHSPVETPPTNTLDSTTTVSEANVKPVSQNFSVEVLEGEQGWGYNILLNGKAIIRQPNIPSLPGNKGFDNEGKAQKVADYVLNKVKNGIMPPTISKVELDSLGVI